MITEEDVIAIVALDFPTYAIPGAKVAEEYHVPCFLAGPCEIFMAAGPWNYSWIIFGSLHDLHSSYLAVVDKYRDQLNGKVAVLCVDDDDGRVSRQLFASIFEHAGYEIAYADFYAPGTSDFTSIVARLKEANCDVLYFNGLPDEFATFWRQCATLGYWPKMAIVQRAIHHIPWVEAVGDHLCLGVITYCWWHPKLPYPYNDWIEENILKKAPIELGYEAGYWVEPLMVLKDAIERAGTLDREAINKAIAETDIMGPTGRIKFDLETHTCKGPVTIAQWHIENGTWVLEPVWSQEPGIPTKPIIFPLPPPH